MWSLKRIGSGADFLWTIASSAHALWGFSLEITAETMNGVICTSPNRDFVVSEKSEKDALDESSLEFEENLRGKHSALSADAKILSEESMNRRLPLK